MGRRWSLRRRFLDDWSEGSLLSAGTARGKLPVEPFVVSRNRVVADFERLFERRLIEGY
ncbi:MAG: hypothetical protein MI923_04330 [Phycisphaerales bacterium]|nr:hypothetical protein [Phycisphaerales bacterium]